MLVSEAYVSWQGEGKNLGRRSIFLRTQGCPVGCGWCDSKFTWDFDKSMGKTVEEVLEMLAEFECSHIVFTGGEPFAQKDITQYVEAILNEGYTIEFETSGTYLPPHPNSGVWDLVEFNVSAKPPSAQTKVPTNDEAMAYFIDKNSTFKFVCNGQEDLDWICDVVTKYGIYDDEVYVMPQGMDSATCANNLRFITEALPQVLPGANVTPRMHIDIWGHLRKR